MRDPKRIDTVLNKLKELWELVPDWRLGQLVCNIGREGGHWDPFYLEDKELMRIIDQQIKEYGDRK